MKESENTQGQSSAIPSTDGLGTTLAEAQEELRLCQQDAIALQSANERLRTALEIARGALADIYTSTDMTLRLVRKKAKRIYLETGPNFEGEQRHEET